MSDKVPSVTEKTVLIADAVTLFVNGRVFDGWEDLQVTRELNAAASDFQLQFTDKWREDQETWRIQPGDAVHIHVGKDTILTGYVDALAASMTSNGKTLTVNGRSKTGDLVDCSVTGDNSFSGLNLKEVAEKLLKPFNIQAVFFTDPGAAFPNVTVQQGETVFALLDRLARQRKIIVYPTVFGNLAFDIGGKGRSGTTLKQGVNILSGSANYDNSDRFSEYTTKGQNLSGFGTLVQSTSGQGKAVDQGVSRFRPMVLVAETTTDDQAAADRASYEANIRAAKALEVQIEVQGWRKADGTLWDINQLIPVDCGFLGVRRKLLSKRVTLIKNNSGTTCQISLVRKEAFEFKAVVPKEDALGWAKGLG